MGRTGVNGQVQPYAKKRFTRTGRLAAHPFPYLHNDTPPRPVLRAHIEENGQEGQEGQRDPWLHG